MESAAGDLAFILLDYDEPDRVIHRRLQIGFLMSGMHVDAKPDTCILDDEDFVLLVQEDKVCKACVLDERHI